MNSKLDITKCLENIKMMSCSRKHKDYLFNNEHYFRRGLSKLNRWYGEDIEEIIDHEREHFNKTIELGYNPPKYGIQIITCSFLSIKLKPVFDAFVRFNKNDKIPPKDMTEILLAPKKPGYADKIFAKKCELYIAWEARQR